MRSQLNLIPQIVWFETDIVAQTATFACTKEFDWKAELDRLALEHDKFEDWAHRSGD